MKKKIRVAQVATAAMSVRYLLLDHIQRLLAEGYEVEAVCADDESLALVEGQGIVVRRVPFVREPSPAADARTIGALWSLFRERRYDVVHSHTPKAGLLAPVAAQLARVPFVLHTVHGLLFHDRSTWKEKLLGGACELWSAKFSDRLLSQSQEDIGVIRRFHLKAPDRVDLIGNGIDVARFHPDVRRQVRGAVRAELGIADDEIVVGMVGRLVREKGFVEFYAAMQEVMKDRPRVRTLIIGSEDVGQSDALTRASFVSKLDPSRVIWLGHRNDLPRVYSAMDVFALPSYREGIPRTLMEASAMGLPVVATDIRGCREVAPNELSGLLVEPRQVPGLARALARLTDDGALRARLGAAGRARIVAEFNSVVVLDRLAAYYKRIVGEPAA
jgi:glycosyltransferase involved in cell wall biosynthesis